MKDITPEASSSQAEPPLAKGIPETTPSQTNSHADIDHSQHADDHESIPHSLSDTKEIPPPKPHVQQQSPHRTAPAHAREHEEDEELDEEEEMDEDADGYDDDDWEEYSKRLGEK